ncbi:hypothetical protein WR25_19039 isoform B [Diploscapter pachys]|uniref:[histone H3]-lysine(27) N-trimethyltransferase n=1 Tax=Diploscapter pachys TaxID=2018661 RepID=A0A2A2JK39_9BILA|nr:hypothetical protein WR25_19039 isoform B [Diploscapter pachys]
MSSMWPYLKTLDPSIKETKYGWVMAFASLGQCIGSPLMGLLAGKIEKIRFFLSIGLLLRLISHLLYLSLPLLTSGFAIFMAAARFTAGLGSGNTPLLRYFATTKSSREHRASAMAILSAGSSLGGMIGPGVHFLYSLLVAHFSAMSGSVLNNYSFPAWFSSITTLIALPVVFLLRPNMGIDENDASIEENSTDSKEDVIEVESNNYAMFIALLTRFTQGIVQSSLDTVSTPYFMAVYGYSKTETVYLIGFIVLYGCIIPMQIVTAVTVYSKCLTFKHGFFFGIYEFTYYLAIIISPIISMYLYTHGGASYPRDFRCTHFVVFGDNLSDDGTEAVGESHGFLRNSNGKVWPEYVNDILQCDQYTNYAYSGAKSGVDNFYFSNWSGVAWQVSRYIETNPYSSEEPLVILQTGGAIDFFTGEKDSATVVENIHGTINKLTQSMASGTLLIFALVDLGSAPGVRSAEEGEELQQRLAELVAETNRNSGSEMKDRGGSSKGIRPKPRLCKEVASSSDKKPSLNLKPRDKNVKYCEDDDNTSISSGISTKHQNGQLNGAQKKGTKRKAPSVSSDDESEPESSTKKNGEKPKSSVNGRSAKIPVKKSGKKSVNGKSKSEKSDKDRKVKEEDESSEEHESDTSCDDAGERLASKFDSNSVDQTKNAIMKTFNEVKKQYEENIRNLEEPRFNTTVSTLPKSSRRQFRRCNLASYLNDSELKLFRESTGLKSHEFRTKLKINKAEPREAAIKTSLYEETQNGSKRNVQSVRTLFINAIPKMPPMNYWVHVECNIRGDDSHRLTHLPFVSEDQDDRAICKDLLKLFEEGVHGAERGCGEYLNNWMLVKLIKDIKENGYQHDDALLFYSIFRLFPNKFSHRQIADQYTDLCERFMTPEERLREEKNRDKKSQQDGHSVLTTMCVRCDNYDCMIHGIGANDDLVQKETVRFMSGSCKQPEKPCGPKCYLHSLPASFDHSQVHLENLPIQNYHCFLLSILLKGVKTACDLAKEAEIILDDEDMKSITCAQLFDMIKEHEKKNEDGDSMDYKRKSKKSDKDKHRAFRMQWAGEGSRIQNARRMEPCNHEGACGADNPSCSCGRSGICFNLCACPADCKIRFPGCRCAPGNCRTRQCQCYYAQWECDPAICKNCNCDYIGCDAEHNEEEPKVRCKNTSIGRGLQKKLKVGVSNIAGFGCFIDEPAEKGELISEYTGELITSREAERRGNIYDKFGCSYIFDLNKDQSLDANRMGNLIRFANHSGKMANCYSAIMIVNGDHRVAIFAKRNIEKGEELFFDYRYNRQAKGQFVPYETPLQTKDGKIKNKAKKLPKVVEELDDYSMEDSENEDVQKKKKKVKAGSKKHVTARRSNRSMNNTMNEDSESSSSEEEEEEEEEIKDKKKRNSRGPGRPKKEAKSDSEESEESQSEEESDNGNLNGSRTLRNKNKPSNGAKNSRTLVSVSNTDEANERTLRYQKRAQGKIKSDGDENEDDDDAIEVARDDVLSPTRKARHSNSLSPLKNSPAKVV